MSEASWNIGLLAAYGGLLGTATVIIFAGAHSSLPVRSSILIIYIPESQLEWR